MNDNKNKVSILASIGSIFLFIILIPFNIVKYISIGVNKIMKKDKKNQTLNLEQNKIEKTNEHKIEEGKDLNRKSKIIALDENDIDSKRSNEKMIFKYNAKNKDGKIEKGKFLGYSKIDVHSYLLSEGYEVYEIKEIAKANIFNTEIGLNRPMKKSILVFYLTQLSTYLKAGITIVDSIKILSTQSKTNVDKIIWKSVVYELSMGATLSEAMRRMGVIFPKLCHNPNEMAGSTTPLFPHRRYSMVS